MAGVWLAGEAEPVWTCVRDAGVKDAAPEDPDSLAGEAAEEGARGEHHSSCRRRAAGGGAGKPMYLSR